LKVRKRQARSKIARASHRLQLSGLRAFRRTPNDDQARSPFRSNLKKRTQSWRRRQRALTEQKEPAHCTVSHNICGKAAGVSANTGTGGTHATVNLLIGRFRITKARRYLILWRQQMRAEGMQQIVRCSEETPRSPGGDGPLFRGTIITASAAV